MFPLLGEPNLVSKKHQVRLVHQSMKEFIVEEMNEGQSCDVPLKQTVYLTFDQHPQNLEAFILDIYIKYLLLEDIGNRGLFSEEQVGIL